jgi:PadR family transcriptional regulator PadR
MQGLSAYEQKLLQGWEDVYKKSQLTLWIMLALKDGPKHMAEIKQFIAEATNHILSADDQSMYRALRRYTEAELLNFTTQPGSAGPDLKIYHLTPVGHTVTKAFAQRNINTIFFKPEIKNLLES